MGTGSKAYNKRHNPRPVTFERNQDKITPKRRKRQVGILRDGHVIDFFSHRYMNLPDEARNWGT